MATLISEKTILLLQAAVADLQAKEEILARLYKAADHEDKSVKGHHMDDESCEDKHIKKGINATKIANGCVNNTEFCYLDGVTSPIQTQINNIIAGADLTTASNVGSGSQVFKAEVGNDLQFRTLSAGANVTITQNLNDITIASTGGGSPETDPYSLHLNGDNAPSADLSMGSFKLKNLSNGTLASDAVNKGQMDAANSSQDSAIALKAAITYVDSENAAQDTVIASKASISYVDSENASQDSVIASKADDSAVIKKNGSVAFTADESMGGFKLTNLASPAASSDAANKSYVDTEVPDSTSDLPEGSNLYYTDARSDARITLQKAAANGLASLDGAGKVPVGQLPNSVMEYQGSWDASSNSPVLADGVGNAGDVYRINVAGSQNLGSGSETYFVGDFVIYSGSIWERSPLADGVVSVNSMSGAVVLDSDDISEGGSNLYFTNARALSATSSTYLKRDGSNSPSADISWNSYKLINLANGSSAADAVNKGQLDLKSDITYVDSQDALKVSKSGDSMSGNLNMSSNKITNLSTPTSANDAANKSYVDAVVPESSTASNLGSGSQVFKALSSYDLQFRSLSAGSGISIVQNANDISISASGGSGANQSLSNLTSPTAMNEILRGQNGSAGSPAYSFISDIDSGLYRSAADEVSVSSGGVQSLSLKLNATEADARFPGMIGTNGRIYLGPSSNATAPYIRLGGVSASANEFGFVSPAAFGSTSRISMTLGPNLVPALYCDLRSGNDQANVNTILGGFLSHYNDNDSDYGTLSTGSMARPRTIYVGTSVRVGNEENSMYRPALNTIGFKAGGVDAISCIKTVSATEADVRFPGMISGSGKVYFGPSSNSDAPYIKLGGVGSNANELGLISSAAYTASGRVSMVIGPNLVPGLYVDLRGGNDQANIQINLGGAPVHYNDNDTDYGKGPTGTFGRPQTIYVGTSIAVGTTTAPTASQIARFVSTTKGVVFPNATVGGIATPSAGMVIFDTGVNKLKVYSGTAWETITSA